MPAGTAALAVLLLVGCASPRPDALPSGVTLLQPVQTLVWRGETGQALAALEELRWARSGSISAERLRQDLRLARGDRAGLLAELHALEEAHAGDPDLHYLRSRVLEDPQRRDQQLRSGLARHPDHDWLRLGAAATAQTLGDWKRARALLEELRGWPDAAVFRRVVLARQLAHDGRPLPAFGLLEEAAFDWGEEAALLTWLQLAQQYGDQARALRARTEISVRRAVAWGYDEGARIDQVFARLEAEWPWMQGADLDEALRAVDRWAALADVEGGWQAQPRYSAPPFASLVKPEPSGGGPAARWAAAGRVLLAGEAMGRGTEMHLLTGVATHLLAWPGEARPLEVLVSDGAASASGELPQGGAVLRGFFLRLDQATANARSIARALDGFTPAPPRPELLPEASRFESWDLPRRLQAAQLAAGSDADREALAALTIHEAGHLPETLPWTRWGVPVLRLLPRFIGSLSRYGDPVLWLEYRAQARALASGRATRWLLAETVARANEPRDPYHEPYRALLDDLLELAEQEGLPPLWNWDQLAPQRVAALAESLCRAQDVELLPEAGLAALDALIAELDPR